MQWPGYGGAAFNLKKKNQSVHYSILQIFYTVFNEESIMQTL